MRGRLAEEITNKVKGDNKVQFNATVIERKNTSTTQGSSAIYSVQIM